MARLSPFIALSWSKRTCAVFWSLQREPCSFRARAQAAWETLQRQWMVSSRWSSETTVGRSTPFWVWSSRAGAIVWVCLSTSHVWARDFFLLKIVATWSQIGFDRPYIPCLIDFLEFSCSYDCWLSEKFFRKIFKCIFLIYFIEA